MGGGFDRQLLIKIVWIVIFVNDKLTAPVFSSFHFNVCHITTSSRNGWRCELFTMPF